MDKSSKISSKFDANLFEIYWNFSCSLANPLKASKVGTFETTRNIGAKFEHYGAEKS